MAQLQNTNITGSLVVSGTSPAGTVSSSNNITTAKNLYVNGSEIQTKSTSFSAFTKNVTSDFEFATAPANIIFGREAFAGGKITFRSSASFDGPLTVSGSTILGDGYNTDTTTINGNLTVQGSISSSGNITTAGNLTVNGTLNATTNTLTFTNLTASSLLVNNNLTATNLLVNNNLIVKDVLRFNSNISTKYISMDNDGDLFVYYPSTFTLKLGRAVAGSPAAGGGPVTISGSRLILNGGGGNGCLSIKQTSQAPGGGFSMYRSNTGDDWTLLLDDVTSGGPTDNALIFYFNNIRRGYINSNASGGSLNFTGQHRNTPKDNILAYNNKIGLIVVSDGEYKNINEFNSISINESLPIVTLSSKRNQKSVFGVISNLEDVNDTQRSYEQGAFVSIFEKSSVDDNKLIINSLGEGAIWVCNINGNLENGDYITTCEIPGYGMKQDDDLLHNYTVAKITCDCNFDLNSPIYMCEEFEFSGSTYRKAFVGCTYHCG